MCVYRWKGIPSVSPQQVKAFLNALPPTCTRFDNAGKIMLYLFRLGMHHDMCAIVRLGWPTENTHGTNVLPTVFGWTYTGSAAPVPTDPNANCQGHRPAKGVDSNVQSALDNTCVVLGIPFLFLELFTLLLFAGILLFNLADALYDFFEVVWYAVELVIIDTFEVFGLVIKIMFLL
jgi:hypothetical protein